MEEKRKNDWYGLKPSWVPEWVSITLVVMVVFVLAMLFYGETSYVNSSVYDQQISELKQEIKANQDTAQAYRRRISELNTDPERLEHIAREKYGMKRENEDVYVSDIP